MKISNKKLGLIIVTSAMSACVTAPANNASEVTGKLKTEAEIIVEQGRTMKSRPTASREFDDVFVLGDAFEASPWGELPSFLKQNIVFKQKEPISFAEIMSELSNQLDLRIVVSHDGNAIMSELDDIADSETAGSILQAASLKLPSIMLRDQPGSSQKTNGVIGEKLLVRVDHNGSVASLLDRVTTQAGLYWEWRNDHIVVFHTKVKSFALDAQPTVTTMSSSVSTARSNSDSAGGAASSSQLTSDIYTSEDVYANAMDTITGMLSTAGKADKSRGLGLITIRDIPPVLAEIENYIKRVNSISNRNVSIRTQIYEITVNDKMDAGIDWEALFSGSSKYDFGLASSFTGGDIPNLTGSVLSSTSKFKNAMFALRSQNVILDLSTVTDHTTVTKHNHASPIQIGNEKGYLEEMSIEAGEATEGGGTSSPTVTLKPGKVLDGITMSALPRILSDGTIDLRVAIDSSDLNSIDEIRVGEGDNTSLIQVTDVTGKSFSNTVNVKSGETIMLASFEKSIDESETKSLFGEMAWMLGGSKKGGKNKVISVILITPYAMAK
jgi:type IVB pilus formation R64 PilN family outer membrane protein